MYKLISINTKVNHKVELPTDRQAK